MAIHLHGRGPGHLCRFPYALPTQSGNNLLGEDGSFLISEAGAFLVAEDSPAVNYIVTEAGGFILAETGQPLITEH